MEFKNGQVKILANKHTGRELFVDLQDVILNPGSSEEITLGKFLNNLSKENEANKKEIEKINIAVKGLLAVTAKLNLK